MEPETNKKIVIWGASGHAAVVADILRLRQEFSIEGYLDDMNPQRWGSAFGGASILGGQEQLELLPGRGVDSIALGIGDCSVRLKLSEIAVNAGFQLVTVIHPSAVISPSARLGRGTVVCAGGVVNPQATIGNSVIVNTGSSVDHDCLIADGVHIAPGVRLAGSVTVGRCTMMGVGSVVRDGINIGENCIIGAGAVVVNDLPDGVTAYGVPARVVDVSG